MSNDALIVTLKGLKRDPALVESLYRQLFSGRFWAIAQRSSADLEHLNFLTYPASNKLRELPIFTDPKCQMMSQLSAQAVDSMVIEAEGKNLWPRMLNIVITGQCEVAIDPGEEYGIRITREMILGMVKTSGN